MIEDHPAEITKSARAGRKSSRLRNIAIGMVLGLLLAIAALGIAMVVLRGEQLPAVTAENLAAADELWKTKGPSNYDFDLEQTGINPGKIHVEVRNGEVTTMTRDGRATRENTWDYWSVPGLLGVIRRDLEVCLSPKPPGQPQPAIPRGQFDQRDGHPLAYHRVTETGADAKWRITKFEER